MELPSNIRIRINDEYELSLAQENGTYPKSDTVEIALFNSRGDFVPINEGNVVLGWVDGKQLYQFLAQFYGDAE